MYISRDESDKRTHSSPYLAFSEVRSLPLLGQGQRTNGSEPRQLPRTRCYRGTPDRSRNGRVNVNKAPPDADTAVHQTGVSQLQPTSKLMPILPLQTVRSIDEGLDQGLQTIFHADSSRTYTPVPSTLTLQKVCSQWPRLDAVSIEMAGVKPSMLPDAVLPRYTRQALHTLPEPHPSLCLLLPLKTVRSIDEGLDQGLQTIFNADSSRTYTPVPSTLTLQKVCSQWPRSDVLKISIDGKFGVPCSRTRCYRGTPDKHFTLHPPIS